MDITPENFPPGGVSPVPSGAAMPPSPVFCPQCHQPVSRDAYYCPNCGKLMKEPGLSTSTAAQIWLYAFSIVLPIIAFLALSKWDGIKYARSDDPAARQIGYIAIALMVISTIITYWLTIIWIQQYVQSSVNAVNVSGL